ncbi:MAG: redoxin domain-containing protein [Planctomycetes bacterium]|nr:redoxin domain-containing protein [Planctomycetota bacterium]
MLSFRVSAHPLSLLTTVLAASIFAAPAVLAQEATAPVEVTAKEKPADVKADEAKTGEAKAPAAGHSNHGEIFNEGPRQKAYLMGSTGKIDFPVTSKVENVKEFINQGVGQLHGFWYFEAERSFRQAAALDPDCAIAYWGASKANGGNKKRAIGFSKEAMKRKDKASRHEQLHIELWDKYLNRNTKKDKEGRQAYMKSLEKLIYQFPDDLDAKAFLALAMWSNRSRGIPLTSHLSVDALLNDVLDKNPVHPCHHYRIHLWDYEKADLALNSAALAGQSAPGIAHMWHMPGHIYSRLKRYADGAWQQEASARVDHAHMMRDRVLPDQIHNFAHNNEWLIRNLAYLGAADRAVDLAKNMCELPRHPKYNTLTRRGSTYYGRLRLFTILDQFEMWDEMIELADTPYLEPTKIETEQTKRLRYLGRAYFRSGDFENGKRILADAQTRLDAKKKAQDKAVRVAQNAVRKKAGVPEIAGTSESRPSPPLPEDKKKGPPKKVDQAKLKKDLAKAATDAKRRFSTAVRGLDQTVNEFNGYLAVQEERYDDALGLFKKSYGVSTGYKAEITLLAGKTDDAVKLVTDAANSRANQTIPQAALIETLWKAKKPDEAKKAFEKLRSQSGHIDIKSPIFARLEDIATGACGFPADWRTPYKAPQDTGNRPDLDTLGPFRWSPYKADDFTLTNDKGESVKLADYQGRPVVVVFYLGYSCLHCAEQLHKFGPKYDEFKNAGIEVLAISSDPVEDLKNSVEAYAEDTKQTMPFPLLANGDLDVFKKYRCYDDFEDMTLHGTFLIDAQGYVRWQDISYDPFMDPDFVLNESKRLLQQRGTHLNVVAK